MVESEQIAQVVLIATVGGGTSWQGDIALNLAAYFSQNGRVAFIETETDNVNNLMKFTSGIVAFNETVQQGCLEDANVDVFFKKLSFTDRKTEVGEWTSLVDVLRPNFDVIVVSVRCDSEGLADDWKVFYPSLCLLTAANFTSIFLLTQWINANIFVRLSLPRTTVLITGDEEQIEVIGDDMTNMLTENICGDVLTQTKEIRKRVNTYCLFVDLAPVMEVFEKISKQFRLS